MSSIAILKKLNQGMPDGIKRIGAPLIRKKLTNNVIFRSQYDFCQKMRRATAEEINAYQQSQLRSLCAFAYENVLYYKEVFDEAGINPYSAKLGDRISELPLLTKGLLKERFDDLQAASVGDFYEAATGGSTGVPVRVNLERSSIYRERAFIYSYWSLFGYDYSSSKLATFRGVDFRGKVSHRNPLYGEIILNPFLLTEKTILAYLKEIDSYGCDFIQGYPSTVANFCRLLDIKGVRPKKKIKAVFFISENVHLEQMNYISSILNCPCRAFYGHTERSVFAEQVDDALTYSFNPLYGLVEFVPHENGNVVCTGFLNKRMPLIRYAVDDYARLFSDRKYMITGHRDGAELIGCNGERIRWMYRWIFTLGIPEGELIDYQIVQDVPGYAECRIRLTQRLTESQLASLAAILSNKTNGSIRWRVDQDAEFELTARGKMQIVVQRSSLIRL